MYDWKRIPVPGNLADTAYQLIKDYILSQETQMGQRLTTVDLAQKIGISETPVRDTLKRLEAEGLIEVKPRKGTYIISFSVQDVREIYALREYLEALATREVILRSDDRLFNELGRLVKEERALLPAEDDIPQQLLCQLRKVDLAFHETLVMNSRNRRLVNVYRGVCLQSQALKVKPADRGFYVKVNAQHEALVTALGELDGEEAERIIRLHLVDECNAMVEALSSI